MGHLLAYTPRVVLGPFAHLQGQDLIALGATRSSSVQLWLTEFFLIWSSELPPSAPQGGLRAQDGLQRFQRSAQFPLQPTLPQAAAPLASCGLGTLYPLSTGPFLEHLLPVHSFPIQEIQLPPEPSRGQEKEGVPQDKPLRGQDGHAPVSGPVVQFSCPLAL